MLLGLQQDSSTEEESDADFSPWSRGVLPAGSNCAWHAHLRGIWKWQPRIRPGLADNNEQGDYTVTELFLELSLPLLAGVLAPGN